MKHSGKALKAGLKIIYWGLFFLLALLLAAVLAKHLGELLVAVGAGLFGLWIAFGLCCVCFFRDPPAQVPKAADVIVSAAYGKVDVIDEVDEPEWMGGRCRRVSIFLSVFDVHVQRSPVAGRVVWCRHRPGQFLNAMRADSAQFNESVLIGFESSECAGERVGVRLIAGLIARRIVVWSAVGEMVQRGERISLIQFGSRCDVYLPLSATIDVRIGDRVRGGETILARRTGTAV